MTIKATYEATRQEDTMTRTPATTTTYTKLRDGSWGLRGYRLSPGHPTTVCRKDGRERIETPDRILWQRPDGLMLTTIARDEDQPQRHHHGSNNYANAANECGCPCHRSGPPCGRCAHDGCEVVEALGMPYDC